MPTITSTDDLSSWFSRRLPGADRVVVTDVERIARGVSRETWLVEATVTNSAGTNPAGFVIRRDHEVGSVDPISLRHEYEIYRRLEGTAVPAARAVWFEDDTSLAPDDREAYVRTMVEGHWRLPFLSSTDPADDDDKIAASKEHLDKLATIHTVDWQSHGFDDLFPVPDGPGDVAPNLITWFCDRLSEIRCEPSPVLAEGLDWLRASTPTAPAVTLCKGTNGHGEEIWHDGRIVAMSDWELACIAEPAYDLAQCQEMIPTIERDGELIWGWDQALAYYRDQSGIDVSSQNVRWYRLFYALPMFLFTHNAASLVHKGGNRHVRFVWTAAENLYRAELAFATLGGFAPKRVPRW